MVVKGLKMNDFIIQVLKMILGICAWELGKSVWGLIKTDMFEKETGITIKICSVNDLTPEILERLKKELEKIENKAEADTTPKG